MAFAREHRTQCVDLLETSRAGSAAEVNAVAAVVLGNVVSAVNLPVSVPLWSGLLQMLARSNSLQTSSISGAS
jgi:hypothetical protein